MDQPKSSRVSVQDSKWNFDPGWLVENGKMETQFRSMLDVGSTTIREITSGWVPNHEYLTSSIVPHAAQKQQQQVETNLRNDMAVMETQISRMKVAVKHLTAQNMSLRNQHSAVRRAESRLKQEVKSLNDHVNFLRHITAPTPDAGALDVSLAMLRGHELDRARAKEEDLAKRCDRLEQENVDLKLDVTNQTQKLNSAETSFRNVIDKLNSEISKLVTLNKLKEQNCNGLENKISSAAKTHEEREEALRKQLLSHEEIHAIKERNALLDKRVAGLEAELSLERKAKQVIADKVEQQKGELELAWAEIDGRQTSIPRGKRVSAHDIGELDNPRMIEKQLRKEYADREKALVDEINTLKAAATKHEPLVSASNDVHKHVGVNTHPIAKREDEFTERLMAYHEQLEKATKELNKAHHDNLLRRYQLVTKDAANLALQKTVSSRQHELERSKAATLATQGTSCDIDLQDPYKEQELLSEIGSLQARTEKLSVDVSSLKRDKALLAADLAVSRNEVSRLQAESARQKATKRSGHCQGCVRSRKLLEISKKELDGLKEEVRKLHLP